jgi:hypothetical protein
VAAILPPFDLVAVYSRLMIQLVFVSEPAQLCGAAHRRIEGRTTKENDADVPRLWVGFVDYLGATWYRDLGTARYVSERTMQRVQKRNPNFLHIDFVEGKTQVDAEPHEVSSVRLVTKLLRSLFTKARSAVRPRDMESS